MTIRVVLLAAECEPWAKTGGLADVVDALARALGRLPTAGTEPATPVDVFLPRYRSVPVPADAVARAAARRSRTRAAASQLEVGDRRRGRRRLPAAARGPARRLRPRRVLRLPDDPWRFAVFNRAALAALKRDGAPIDVLHVHDWHTGPALLERARGEAADDPFFRDMAVMVTLHNLAYHGWTAARPAAAARPQGGEPLAGAEPARHRPAADRRSRAPRWRTPSRPGFARGVADARVRDGARRGAARQGRPLRRDPQRHRPGRLEPGRRPGARRAVLARGHGGQGRLPRGPPRAQRLRSGRRRRSCSG